MAKADIVGSKVGGGKVGPCGPTVPGGPGAGPNGGPSGGPNGGPDGGPDGGPNGGPDGDINVIRVHSFI
ncbi:hypothetical protein [Paenibacillus sp. GM2]|uniref:hypothetical protein n=1 Tax=Paenibacillus sp. GM2 TaxID=1622070 RepID=UPI0009EED368|nr:hypothetical protein [Paenibacillus sp. GM2]